MLSCPYPPTACPTRAPAYPAAGEDYGAGTGLALAAARARPRALPAHTVLHAQHPLQPSKPPGGALLYSRSCAPERAVLELMIITSRRTSPPARKTATAGCTSSSARQVGRLPPSFYSPSYLGPLTHSNLAHSISVVPLDHALHLPRGGAHGARVVGEPKRANAAIVRTSVDSGMHLETSFYFPYKHSVMTMNLRERLIKGDMFH
ncbi:hypothetical protein DFH11DRAFT_1882719 [Phellopilus nigrolimitatus]|nr:hypothetical protein DFH11DRAFT_1882719 [Phellopilus nigrolimitatus]